jgi:hypothetical protein
LGTILNRHADVFVSPEQYALPFASIRFRLLNILGWKYLVNMCVREFSRKDNYRTPIDFSDMIPRLYNLEPKDRSLYSILNSFNLRLASDLSHSPKIWGDKTPENTRKYFFLKPILDGSKLIFMIRDGRDVVSSFAKANKEDFGINSDPVVAARNWAHSVNVWKDLKRSFNPTDVLLIRYEDLTMNPESTVKRICEHLGLSFDPSILENNSKDMMDVAGLQDHVNATKAVNPGSIGSWKKRLSEETLQEVLPILQEGLTEMGYD